MKTWYVTYAVNLDGTNLTRGFNTSARRRLSMNEILSRAKRHAKDKKGKFLGCVFAKTT